MLDTSPTERRTLILDGGREREWLRYVGPVPLDQT